MVAHVSQRYRVVLAGMILLGGLLSAGCSTQTGYQMMRDNGLQKAECDRRATMVARMACEREYEMSFEEYRYQRACAPKRCEPPERQSSSLLKNYFEAQL
ncbi:MAG: hypothetical protein AAF513_00340 [Pseudomonadota bacterium]